MSAVPIHAKNKGRSMNICTANLRVISIMSGRMRMLAIIVATLFFAVGAEAVAPWPVNDSGYTDAGETIYVDDEITFITVTMNPADLADCLANPHSDVYRLCSVHVVNSRIDETVNDVGIRPRGNTSRDAVKKSWKLKFNEFVPGREFHGVEKFNINGEHNDVSVIRSKLAWDLFNRMGVPSPRAAHVHFKINDGSDVEGVYINIEQIDDEFVDAWFGSDIGNLYKCLYLGDRADLKYVAPGLPETYQNLGSGETYQEENNEDNPDFTDLANFIDFINNSDDATFAAGIIDRFSVDSFLRSMAIDVAIGNWDNYWYGSNNYFLYHNPESDRFEYIPYDLDNTYGVDFFGVDWAARPFDAWGNGGYGSSGGQLPPLIRRVLEVPEYNDQYRRYLRQLVGLIEGGGAGDPVWSNHADTVGDICPSTPDECYDITAVDIGNDATNLYIKIHVNGPVAQGGESDGVKYVVLLNTKPGGATSNPWGRLIAATEYHDYFLGSWVNGGGNTQVWSYNGGWNYDKVVGIDLSQALVGIVSYTIPLSDLGLGAGDSFLFDVAATPEGDNPGFDHLSNPSVATPNWVTPSVPGPYIGYTVQTITVDPPQVVDGPFTLPECEDKIDSIKTIIDPYVFEGSFAGGAMDWGFTKSDFSASYTLPTSYATSNPWNWGLKPYIVARTASLRNTVDDTSDLPPLYVNEILAFNCTGPTDEAGDYDDWVEIYNAGTTGFDVGGMYLTDDPASPTKWQFPTPTMVPAGSFLVVWCDDQPEDGPLHATFKLSSGGEGVGIYHTDAERNVLVDYLAYPGLVGDVSFGRYPDGADDVEPMTNTTPGAANDNSGGPPPEPEPVPAVFINEWMADNDNALEDPDEPGSYEDWIELYNDEEFAVDLGGMFITDNLDDKTKYTIPAGVTIAPKGFLIIWADDDDEQGPTHTTFKLGAAGEEIGLFDSRENCLAEIDAIVFGAQTTDVSEGRYSDGRSCIKVLSNSSPGQSNMVLPGDFEDDQDVDSDDYVAFATCLAGPGLPATAECGECVDADFDDDGDVDLIDFAVLQANFSG